MGQRNSGYERVEHDFYQTPPWATRALLPHIHPRVRYVWEPAAGEGRWNGGKSATIAGLVLEVRKRQNRTRLTGPGCLAVFAGICTLTHRIPHN